jgi:hypothetical protein
MPQQTRPAIARRARSIIRALALDVVGEKHRRVAA